MTLFSMSSRSSVDRASAQCLGGHGFRFLSGTRIFFLPHARVMLNISSFTFNYRAQKFTIFKHLSLLMMNSAVLIQAVSGHLSHKVPLKSKLPPSHEILVLRDETLVSRDKTLISRELKKTGSAAA